MKQIRNTIVKAFVCCLVLLSGLSCSKDAELPGGSVASDGNSIILNISSASVPVTRATASGAEVTVDHLDVLIFDANESAVYSERVSVASGSSSIILTAKKSDFTGDEFYVYLIANSTAEASVFLAQNLPNVDALRSMTQTDENIHMTGLENATGVPTSFLMDGVAYSGTTEPDYVSTVVLNDGLTGNTELAVTLRRAAAKVVVTINQGSSVQFDWNLEIGNPVYYVSNMPYTTSVIAGVDGAADLRTPDPASSSDYFSWNSNAGTITVTAYMYAHSWSNESAYENEVRLVVNIPMTDNSDESNPEVHESNYYQIPISEQKVLNRNTCYLVTATVNAPGSTEAPTPVLLDDVTYSVLDWDVTTIDIGGSTETAAYLTLNEYEMELHNMTDDETTLHFVSSSDVTVEVTDVYYYNKYNVDTHLTTTDGTSWSTTDGTTSCEITITPDEGITGYLHVHSDLPDNNAVRYIVLTVTNEEGVSRQVVIAQYPLEYITNIQSWYSYRTDFVTDGYGLTTYELLAGYSDSYVLSYSSTQELVTNESWICGCTWSNNAWSYGATQNGFFGSKVADTSPYTDGRADVYLYHWERQTSSTGVGPQASTTYSYNRTTQTGQGVANLDNARMYHVQLTATSGDYTLGRPRMITLTDPLGDGYDEERADSGQDNAELVSPSFIIASELGGAQGSLATTVDIAASHCARYAEVFTNAAGETIHFTDWRLPTTAEIAIILKFQDTSDAMDNVLPGPQYWSASGNQVAGEGSSNPGVVLPTNESNAAVRCVRDAYEDESIFAQYQ